MKDEREIVFEEFCKSSLDLKPYQQVWKSFQLNHEDYGKSKFSQENEFTNIQSKLFKTGKDFLRLVKLKVASNFRLQITDVTMLIELVWVSMFIGSLWLGPTERGSNYNKHF